MNKLLIVDGSNPLFRMFFGMPARIVNKNGKAIQGTLGFTGALKQTMFGLVKKSLNFFSFSAIIAVTKRKVAVICSSKASRRNSNFYVDGGDGIAPQKSGR